MRTHKRYYASTQWIKKISDITRTFILELGLDKVGSDVQPTILA